MIADETKFDAGLGKVNWLLVHEMEAEIAKGKVG